jgi:glutathione S-transferase
LIRLHYHPISPYARKVLFAAYEKGLEFASRIVPPGPWREQAQAMNGLYPLGMTPVLETKSGAVLGESGILVEYLDTQRPEPRFVPADPQQALEVRMWDRIVDAYLIAPAGALVFERRKPTAVQSTSRCEALRERLQSTLGVLEHRLLDTPYLNGPHFRLPDLGGCAGVAILETLEFPLESFPSVRRWHAALAERAAWQRVLAETERTPIHS